MSLSSCSLNFFFSCFFFFKQKTSYEMRISDWSSDVCSSDLRLERWPVQHEITVAIGQIALDLGITLARGNLRVNLPAQVVRQLCTGIGDGLVLAHQAAHFMRQRFIELLPGGRQFGGGRGNRVRGQTGRARWRGREGK